MEQIAEKSTRVIQLYSEAFKQKVVEEYQNGGISQRAIMLKYGIRSWSCFLKWLNIGGQSGLGALAGKRAKFDSITYSCMPSKTSSDSSQNPQALQKKIAELEQQLHNEKLRSEAYQRMIEKAEKELNITIRKKPFTK